MIVFKEHEYTDTERVKDLRQRVRDAMEQPPVGWDCPKQIDEKYMSEPVAVRKARAIALKLSQMPTDLWDRQLFAGSMTLENPRIHAEWGFPSYTIGERPHGCFGHIVPDYPRLLTKGLLGIRAHAESERINAETPEENAFLDSVVIAVDAVMDFAERLADRCESEAELQDDPDRSEELRQMAANLRQSPSKPAQTFWQALQSVWLLHMIFHSTMNGNAMGRLDQYVWPYLEADLEAGRIDMERADCSALKCYPYVTKNFLCTSANPSS